MVFDKVPHKRLVYEIKVHGTGVEIYIWIKD